MEQVCLFFVCFFSLTHTRCMSTRFEEEKRQQYKFIVCHRKLRSNVIANIFGTQQPQTLAFVIISFTSCTSCNSDVLNQIIVNLQMEAPKKYIVCMYSFVVISSTISWFIINVMSSIQFHYNCLFVLFSVFCYHSLFDDVDYCSKLNMTFVTNGNCLSLDFIRKN